MTINLENCMSATTYSTDCRSMLEYLLCRAGLFSLQPTNLFLHHICSNHLTFFTLAEKKRCHVCKLVRDKGTVGIKDIRSISKALAIGIWEEGQPVHNWALYGRPICGSCRKYYEKKYLTDEMRKKADAVFGK